MYVWPHGESTHTMIYGLNFSGSAARFLQTVEGCGFCIAAEVSFLSDSLPPQMQLWRGTISAGIINAEHIPNVP